MSIRNHQLNTNSRIIRPASRLTKICAAGLFGLLFAHPLQASSSVNRQALETIFPGTFEAVVDGYTVSFTAHSDGSLVGWYATATDSGRWSIRSGKLCIMLASWLDGRTECARVVQHDGWYRADNVLFRKAEPLGSAKRESSAER